ncbi:alpha/beta hydrolase [Aequorivita viscosa]|uniref:Predicted esterase n=1 Tax=Aequorivita viscosa TaxID=797419 RepID=A0A1M6MZU1_9FLAO|nr:esterase [Aequorivita viscosa]SDX39864.1 Predicted esterase [Aequorivita viscosa]SHJ88930.1 Predicted esterase [Aequorivita viscosa]
MSIEKQVSYTTSNSYSTLNSLTKKTKNVWIAFHGLGYLSKYFIDYFSELDPEENYIIALQAPSKYYQDRKFKHVGASWLTRENTAIETENVLNYVDAVFKEEISGDLPNLIVMGYSQGVSIAARWVAKRKIQCDTLLLHSGGIPNELEPKDFEFLNPTAKVIYLYGNKDEYITEARKTEEQLKGSELFKNRLSIEVFDGIHEVNRDYLLEISKHV